MVVGCQLYAPDAYTSRKYSWYSFLLEAESTPGTWWERKDFMSMKNPLTPAGIEPATFRSVAQHLNHCATAAPTFIQHFFQVTSKGKRPLENLYYLLTPWSRVLLEKLTGSQLVKKFPAFYGTRRFFTAFRSAHHLSLS